MFDRILKSKSNNRVQQVQSRKRTFRRGNRHVCALIENAPKSSRFTWGYFARYMSMSFPLSETNVSPFDPSLSQSEAAASPVVTSPLREGNSEPAHAGAELVAMKKIMVAPDNAPDSTLARHKNGGV